MAIKQTLTRDLKLPGTDIMIERGDTIEVLSEGYSSPTDYVLDNLRFKLSGRSMRKPVYSYANVSALLDELEDFSPMELSQLSEDGLTCYVILGAEVIGEFDFSKVLDFAGEY